MVPARRWLSIKALPDPHVGDNGTMAARERDRFELERDGFQDFVRHDDQDGRLLQRSRNTERLFRQRWRRSSKREIGAKRVVVFDYTLRTSDDADRGIPERSAKAFSAFTMTTPNGPAPNGCARSLPDEADELLGRGASRSCRSGVRSGFRLKVFHSRSAKRR